MKQASAPASTAPPTPKGPPFMRNEEAIILRQLDKSYFRLLPPELVAKVRTYGEWDFRRDMKAEGDFRLKTGIIGSHRGGKTAVARRYVDGCFTPDFQWENTYVRTTFNVRNFVHEQYYIKHWIGDLGNQRFRTDSDTQVYTRPRSDCIIIVFDVTSGSSFGELEEWRREAERYCLEDAVMVMCGSKIDLAAQRVVPTEAAQEFANAHSMPYIEVSAATGENIEELFQLCIREVFKVRPPAEIYAEQHPPTAQQRTKEPGCALS